MIEVPTFIRTRSELPPEVVGFHLTLLRTGGYLVNYYRLRDGTLGCPRPEGLFRPLKEGERLVPAAKKKGDDPCR